MRNNLAGCLYITFSARKTLYDSGNTDLIRLSVRQQLNVGIKSLCEELSFHEGRGIKDIPMSTGS